MSAEAAVALAPQLAPATSRLVVRSFAAPELALEALWPAVAVPGDFRFVWDPPAGESFVAGGIAAIVRASGENRFQEIRRGGEQILSELEGAKELVRMVGGFAFSPGAARVPEWAEFGDATFVLPRWTYFADAAGPRLVVVGGETEEQLAYSAEQLVAGWIEAQRRLRPARPRVSRLEPPDPEAWRAHVEDALAAIREGRLSKVVLADRSRTRFLEPEGSLQLLLALRRPGRRSTRFACAFGARAFLGASPERLVRLVGSRFETEALAGSIGTGAAAAAILSGSAKDREEHQLVIDAIVTQLEGICDRVEVAEPRVSALSHLQHLRTPIVGVLDRPRHVLEIAELLHPTPAVGGVPHQAALDWIEAAEGASRGWYAGPIGWFDARGDGELLVALRSALAVDAELQVFAGAGIVRGSDPLAEYEETELKKRAILSALDQVSPGRESGSLAGRERGKTLAGGQSSSEPGPG